MAYGYLGRLRTRPGRRDAVVRILVGGTDGLKAAGCQLHVVSVSATDPDTIFVSEVRRSREHHDAALETVVVGGLGV